MACKFQRSEVRCDQHDDDLSPAGDKVLFKILLQPFPHREKAGRRIDNECARFSHLVVRWHSNIEFSFEALLAQICHIEKTCDPLRERDMICDVADVGDEDVLGFATDIRRTRLPSCSRGMDSELAVSSNRS